MKNEDKPYGGIYDDSEYCTSEILLARKIFGNRNTTEDQFEAMLKGLGLMVLYCPEEIKVLAQSTFMEATMRKAYYLSLWGY